MKKNLLRGLAITTILLMLFVTSVTPAFAKGVSVITFTGVSFVPNKGYVFRFSVPKNVKAKKFPGFIKVGKHTYDLKCTIADSTDLVCSPTDSLKSYTGRSVTGAVAGAEFSAIVPKPFVRIAPTCYGIFDYNGNYVWSQIGTYCESGSSMVPSIRFYNPDWEDTFTYYYRDDGSSTVCDYYAPDFGPGYYFDYNDPTDC